MSRESTVLRSAGSGNGVSISDCIPFSKTSSMREELFTGIAIDEGLR